MKKIRGMPTKKIWGIFVGLVLIALFSSKEMTWARARDFEPGETTAPQPELLSPTSEVVDLTGKDSLTFKWSPFIGNLFEREYYEFRLYKGYNQVQANEIYRQRVPRNIYAVVLKTDMFQNGEVYTWTLRQASNDKFKSDAAYSSFKVIKKP